MLECESVGGRRLKRSTNVVFDEKSELFTKTSPEIAELKVSLDVNAIVELTTSIVDLIGKSGETYAFDRDGLLLSQSRFDDDLKKVGLSTMGDKDELQTRLSSVSSLSIEEI